MKKIMMVSLIVIAGLLFSKNYSICSEGEEVTHAQRGNPYSVSILCKIFNKGLMSNSDGELTESNYKEFLDYPDYLTSSENQVKTTMLNEFQKYNVSTKGDIVAKDFILWLIKKKLPDAKLSQNEIEFMLSNPEIVVYNKVAGSRSSLITYKVPLNNEKVIDYYFNYKDGAKKLKYFRYVYGTEACKNLLSELAIDNRLNKETFKELVIYTLALEKSENSTENSKRTDKSQENKLRTSIANNEKDNIEVKPLVRANYYKEILDKYSKWLENTINSYVDSDKLIEDYYADKFWNYNTKESIIWFNTEGKEVDIYLNIKEILKETFENYPEIMAKKLYELAKNDDEKYRLIKINSSYLFNSDINSKYSHLAANLIKNTKTVDKIKNEMKQKELEALEKEEMIKKEKENQKIIEEARKEEEMNIEKLKQEKLAAEKREKKRLEKIEIEKKEKQFLQEAEILAQNEKASGNLIVKKFFIGMKKEYTEALLNITYSEIKNNIEVEYKDNMLSGLYFDQKAINILFNVVDLPFKEFSQIFIDS
ncbi:MAG: hypothetical protein JXL97_15600, partial [Bacteroidales bacterium]|nr:hypothetical protein [Bacteroidales bacterium]